MLRAFGLKISSDQAQGALGAVLEAMRSTTNRDALKPLGAVVEALAPSLGSEQAQQPPSAL